MIDERRLLERVAGSVAPPEHVMAALHRRRERKLRNRRLGALVLAACLTVALVAGVIQAIHGAERRQPASPTITPGNVGALQQIATDRTFPQQGFRTATGDGILAMGTSKFRADAGELVVYPFPCAGTDEPCTPLWHARIDGPGMPVVADGLVFATGLNGDTLYAFPDRCGSDGSVCRPMWTAQVDGSSSSHSPLVVSEGGTTRVYVAAGDAVLAFEPGCATDGGRCSPVGSIETDHRVLALASANGLMYVGMENIGQPDLGGINLGPLSVYSVQCLVDHPVRNTACIRWTRHVGPIWDLAVDASGVYAGLENGGVEAFPIACIRSGSACRPSWTAETADDTLLTVADGVVYADDQTQHTFAFSTSCASSGDACAPLWTSRGVLGSPFQGFERPVVSGGLVFVGGDAGWIYAYDRSCSGWCDPSSRIFIADQNGIPGIWDARVSGDRLYVAAEDGLHVYAPGSPRAVEVPSAGEAPIFYLALGLVGGTLLVVSIRRRRRLQP